MFKSNILKIYQLLCKRDKHISTTIVLTLLVPFFTFIKWHIPIFAHINLSIAVAVLTVMVTFIALTIPIAVGFSQLNKIYGDSTGEMLNKIIGENKLREIMQLSFWTILFLITVALFMSIAPKYNILFILLGLFFLFVARYLGSRYCKIVDAFLLLHDPNRYRKYLDNEILSLVEAQEQYTEKDVDLLHRQRSSLETYYITHMGYRYVSWQGKSILALFQNIIKKYQEKRQHSQEIPQNNLDNDLALRMISLIFNDLLSDLPTVQKNFYRIKYIERRNAVIYMMNRMLTGSCESLRELAKEKIDNFFIVAWEQLHLNTLPEDCIASQVILGNPQDHLSKDVIDAFCGSASYFYGVAAKKHPVVILEFLKSLYGHAVINMSSSLEYEHGLLRADYQDEIKYSNLINQLNHNEKAVADFLNNFDDSVAFALPTLPTDQKKSFKEQLIKHYYFLKMQRLCAIILSNLASYKRWDTIIDIIELHNPADSRTTNIGPAIISHNPMGYLLSPPNTNYFQGESDPFSGRIGDYYAQAVAVIMLYETYKMDIYKAYEWDGTERKRDSVHPEMADFHPTIIKLQYAKRVLATTKDFLSNEKAYLPALEIKLTLTDDDKADLVTKTHALADRISMEIYNKMKNLKDSAPLDEDTIERYKKETIEYEEEKLSTLPLFQQCQTSNDIGKHILYTDIMKRTALLADTGVHHGFRGGFNVIASIHDTIAYKTLCKTGKSISELQLSSLNEQDIIFIVYKDSNTLNDHLNMQVHGTIPFDQTNPRKGCQLFKLHGPKTGLFWKYSPSESMNDSITIRRKPVIEFKSYNENKEKGTVSMEWSIHIGAVDPDINATISKKITVTNL